MKNMDTKAYDTYLFDLDGTLLDTIGDLAASCNHALAGAGLPQKTTGQILLSVGNGFSRLIELIVPGGKGNRKFQQVYDSFAEHYAAHGLDTTQPYPGVERLLRNLKAAGKRIAVVSNKRADATESLCRHFFGDTVEVAIGETADIRRKPAPDTVEEALRRLGAGKEGAVYIGDSEVDVATAKAAGLPCISVLWGFRTKETLLQHGADTFVSSPDEIAP